MKGGFLDKAISREAASKPRREEEHGQKVWDEGTVAEMVEVLTEILNDNNRMARSDLERRLRSGTGGREFRGRCAGMPEGPLPGEEEDTASRLLREFTRPSAMREHIEPIMGQATEIFGRVQAKGAADGLKMDKEESVSVLRDVIKECMIRHILKCMNAENSEAHASGSHDAGLLATPAGYTAGDLNSLDSDCIRGLMERGWGFVDGFVDETVTSSVHRELELLDFDGKFVEVQQQKMTGYRTDRIHWLSYDSLDREKQQGLSSLMKKMMSIPFELNKKCSLYLQVSGTFQLAVYPVNSGFYRKHVDGGYDDINNGRKITAVFYANRSWSSSDGGQCRLYKRRPNPFQVAKARSQGAEVPEGGADEVDVEVEPVGGRLLLFRSRDVPHEVLRAQRKRYAISLWLMGPPGPGDQPDDHHAPT